MLAVELPRSISWPGFSIVRLVLLMLVVFVNVCYRFFMLSFGCSCVCFAGINLAIG